MSSSACNIDGIGKENFFLSRNYALLFAIYIVCFFIIEHFGIIRSTYQNVNFVLHVFNYLSLPLAITSVLLIPVQCLHKRTLQFLPAIGIQFGLFFLVIALALLLARSYSSRSKIPIIFSMVFILISVTPVWLITVFTPIHFELVKTCTNQNSNIAVFSVSALTRADYDDLVLVRTTKLPAGFIATKILSHLGGDNANQISLDPWGKDSVVCKIISGKELRKYICRVN